MPSSSRDRQGDLESRGSQLRRADMLRFLIGGFFALAGAVVFVEGIGNAVSRLRGRETDGSVILSFIFGAGFIALGAAMLTLDERSTWTPGPTAERVFFGIPGTVMLAGAVTLWILTRRLERLAAEARPKESSEDFASHVVSEGPSEAVMNSFYRAIGLRGSAVLLAAVGTVIASGALRPQIPRGFADSWLVFLDALELVGYAALTFLCSAMVVSGFRSRQRQDIVSGIFFLMFWGIAIGVGLHFGLLDGWLDIVSWLSRLAA